SARCGCGWGGDGTRGLGTRLHQTMSVGRFHHEGIETALRGVANTVARSMAGLAVVAGLTACTERASAKTDSARVTASDTVIDSVVDQPSSRTGAPSPQSDTALSVG